MLAQQGFAASRCEESPVTVRAVALAPNLSYDIPLLNTIVALTALIGNVRVQ